MKISETIEKALVEIETHGWHQGDYSADTNDETSPVCVLGALNRAMTGKANEFTLFDPCVFFFRKEAGIEGLMDAWNDASSTTEEDVKLALKKALHKAQESGV